MKLMKDNFQILALEGGQICPLMQVALFICGALLSDIRSEISDRISDDILVPPQINK